MVDALEIAAVELAVDIENCQDAGGGYNVGWLPVGEWLEYTVNVPVAGEYTGAVVHAGAASLASSMDPEVQKPNTRQAKNALV